MSIVDRCQPDVPLDLPVHDIRVISVQRILQVDWRIMNCDIMSKFALSDYTFQFSVHFD